MDLVVEPNIDIVVLPDQSTEDEDGGRGRKTKMEVGVAMEEISYSLQRETSSSIYSDVYSHGNEKKRKLYGTLGPI